MRKMTRHKKSIIIISTFFVNFTAKADGGPIERMFEATLNNSEFYESFRNFYPKDIPGASTSGPDLYVFVDDISKSFDNSNFRPDGLIMPTNNSLDPNASFPITQHILVSHLKRDPLAWNAFLAALSAKQTSALEHSDAKTPAVIAVLKFAEEGFLIQLKSKVPNAKEADEPFPRALCLIATDFSTGGSNARRDLVNQTTIRHGIENCLVSLDGVGARGVVMPLIGAASFATRTDEPLSLLERDELECRLLDSLSGIALGVHDYLLHPHTILEIGVVQWVQDLDRLFPRGMSDSARAERSSELATYASDVNQVIERGLNGKLTIGSDLNGGDSSGSECALPAKSKSPQH